MAPKALVYLFFYLLVTLAFHPRLVRSENSTSTATSSSSQNATSLFREEAKCYSLPYGTLGFVSHLLTYYSSNMIMDKHRPLMPGTEMRDGHSTWNTTLGLLKLVLTHISSIVTMVRCSHAWQFEAIAAMKLTLSLSSGLNTIFPSGYWTFLYIPGALTGLAGSLGLTHILWNTPDTQKDTVIITAVFFGIPALCVLVALLMLCCDSSDSCGETSMVAFGIVVAFGALYSDWILAVAVHNWIGYPDNSTTLTQVLWVLYFVGKRLNMLVV
ncbi:hypothetical protein ASPZODRAFT_147421 [Penicilliopsis zonata CBS 506.65]|uniref:Uncharacterized protein n=1 Tax=Penicilliopsis zonata CBS 506.65 TaxID=1073090 RepID=A0A1L9S5A6_9EURO|nr:hypothetical protein ASPZODRAFT_147421 [Penicilliopsis zonata CBS 506.65]OJJ42330.1 hypothetical protein ASPZODRAFT_147421 [Penicilliopsis zonata CBS 506.65]